MNIEGRVENLIVVGFQVEMSFSRLGESAIFEIDVGGNPVVHSISVFRYPLIDEVDRPSRFAFQRLVAAIPLFQTV